MAVIAFLSSWLRPSLSRSRASDRKKRLSRLRSFRPALEPLEDRLPPGDLSGNLGASPFSSLLDGVPSSSSSAARPNDSLFASSFSGSHLAPTESTPFFSGNQLDHLLIGPLSPAGPGEVSSAETQPRSEAADTTNSWSLTDLASTDVLHTPPVTGSVADPIAPALKAPVELPKTNLSAAPGSPLPVRRGESVPNAGSPLRIGEAEQEAAQLQPETPLPVVPDIQPDPSDCTCKAGDSIPVPDSPPPPPSGEDPGTQPGAPSTSGLTVVLEAPEVTNRTQPELAVTITLGPELPAGTVLNTAYVDIDLNHDGRFDQPEELAFESIFVFGQQSGTFPTTLSRPLEEGTFQLRARVTGFNSEDFAVSEWTSSTVTMRIDVQLGYIGSEALRRLYGNYVLATTGQVDPVWSTTYWGDPNALPENHGKLQSFQPVPTTLTLDQFYSDFHRRFVHDAQERVLVNVRSMMPRQMPQLRADLEARGIQVVSTSPDQRLVTGYLPIAEIPTVITLPGFAGITPVYPSIRRTGSVTTQGDAVILADAFRTSTGATGNGVTVGVISDSANRVGMGVAASQATGDLGPNVTVLLDGPLIPGGNIDEGRAMMEIVQDVAPAANLLFHTALQSPQIFANAIDVLGNSGARVIVDDIAYVNQPFFNDGLIAQAVERQAAENDVVYVSAAGNDGNDAYDAAWTPVPRTLFGASLRLQDFGGGDTFQNFTLPVGQTIVLAFQWDDSYLEGGLGAGTGGPFEVVTDLDAYVLNAAGTMLLGFFEDFNDLTGEAFEFMVFTNDGSFGSTSFSMMFNHFSGPVPRRMRWIAFTGALSADPMAQGQGGPTIFGTSAARNAIAVGAVNWTTPQVPEPDTGFGGALPFFFDANGNRLSTPELRNKPDLVAPDGVVTSFFPAAAPGNIFDGTSASAPHVAGAVALLLEQAPCATPAQVIPHLLMTALDAGPPGFDPLTGFGLIQVQSLPACPPPGGGGGDMFEPNDTSERATAFNTIVGPQFFTGLSIFDHLDGLPDYDWFRWDAGFTGTFAATITEGTGLGDLELFLYTLDGSTLVLLSRNIFPGLSTRTVSAFVSVGQVLLVEVKGRNSSFGVMDQLTYDLAVNLT